MLVHTLRHGAEVGCEVWVLPQKIQVGANLFGHEHALSGAGALCVTGHERQRAGQHGFGAGHDKFFIVGFGVGVHGSLQAVGGQHGKACGMLASCGCAAAMANSGGWHGEY